MADVDQLERGKSRRQAVETQAALNSCLGGFSAMSVLITRQLANKNFFNSNPSAGKSLFNT